MPYATITNNPTDQLYRSYFQTTAQSAQYTFTDVFHDYCKEKVKDIAKLFSYVAHGAGQVLPNVPGIKVFGSTMTGFKNFIGGTEVPKKTAEAKKAWSDLLTLGYTAHRANEAFKKSMLWVNSFVDGLDFASLFLPVGTPTMKIFKAFNSAATFSNSINGGRENVGKIAATRANETHKHIFHGINLSRDIIYGAVGAYGLSSYVFGTAVAPGVMTAMLTAGVLSSMASYFFERLYDPEVKGKNLNPEVVIRNHMAGRPITA